MKCSTLLGSLLLVAPVAAEGAFHDLTFDEALAAAAKADKVVFVDFFTTWCGPCKKLDEVTWKDAGVIEWLQAETIALKVDAEELTDLASEFEVQAYPTMVFVRPDRSEMGRVLGYRGPEDFLVIAADTLAGISRTDRLRLQLEEAGGLDTMLRFQLGRELMAEEDWEEALEQLIWCWDHGLDHEAGFLGVRTSYLLSDLGRLADLYPPAREALVARRDAAEKAVLELRDEPLAARDLAKLNLRLREPERTLAVWDRMALPDDADDAARRRFENARRTLFDEVLDLLLEQRRYVDVVAASGDPVRAFESGLAAFQSDEPPTEAQTNMANVLRRRAIDRGAKVLEALAGADREDEARALADAILAVDSGYSTYKLLITHAARSGADAFADGLLAEAKQRLPEKYHRRLDSARRRG